MSDTFVTTSIVGAVFSDGSTLSGTWTAAYDPAGDLVAVSNALFTVSGSGGTTTFTDAGTLPYANAASDPSYEIHFLAAPSGGSYDSLYVDWRSETPSSLYEGSPSLYSSVVNGATSPTTPLRLVNDGTTGTGLLPSIDNLAATQSTGGTAPFAPFQAVTVADPNAGMNTGAVITLSVDGSPSDADGILSGNGLNATGIGTYALTATTPIALGAELQALVFTPAAGAIPAGGSITPVFNLYVSDDNGTTAGATTLTVTANCFLPGTRIATRRGEVAVEALRMDDRVLTAAGGDLGVVATACRQVDCRRQASPATVLPVRIRAAAFGPGRPRRDLLLSPDHAVFVEGALIPVKYLVNGSSVARIAAALVSYWHVRLERHDILLAEGLPCESFLDPGIQAARWPGIKQPLPGADLRPLIWEALGCEPLVVTGPGLERARAALMA